MPALLLLALLIPGSVLAQRLGIGDFHTCGVLADGTASCFGWSEDGQTGYGFYQYSSGSPFPVTDLQDAVAIDGGYVHSCALLEDGTMSCWGSNGAGQLGNGGIFSSYVPVAVQGITDAVAFSAGSGHNCAVTADQRVFCWGANFWRQLGIEDPQDRNTPQEVAGITTATAVAAGGAHTCAIVDGGAVQCWGRNNNGQLGYGGTSDTGIATPQTVAGISTATAIGAGDDFSCALIEDQTVTCWGRGHLGQLGDGQSVDSSLPVAVLGITDAIELSVGVYHACALLASGGAACWGHNYYGQVGNLLNRNNVASPTSVLNVPQVLQIAAGSGHSCALVSREPLNVMCWGYGNFGQLGDNRIGGVHERPLPMYVIGGPFDSVFGGDAGSFE